MRRLSCVALCLLAACQQQVPPAVDIEQAAQSQPPSAAEFIADYEAHVLEQYPGLIRTAFVAQTYITTDTQRLLADAYREAQLAQAEAVVAANRYRDQELSAELRRKLELLQRASPIPSPQDAKLAAELADIVVENTGIYSTGEYCRQSDCYRLDDIAELMAESRDEPLLRDLWSGWREIAPPMKVNYQRQVEIANQAAQTMGFAHLAEFWQSGYDMPPDEFVADIDQQWELLEPLYSQLHCHVRARLNAHYGDAVVPPKGPIPAHLLGNVWAQDWSALHDLVAPSPADASYDMDEIVAAYHDDEVAMVRTGEAFFTSLGLEPLPATFWERSMFTRPRDREVECHATAWPVDFGRDVRISICLRKTADYFRVIHHELGHDYYYLAYSKQDALYRGSANDGFHEALGDALALSVTPAYLAKLDMLEEPLPIDDLDFLMRQALTGVAFLPFGLLVDKWRWQVFSGELGPDEYNAGWWALRERYQGIVPPEERSEAYFDPGAKYHIPDNTPYMRYFLAAIMQYQFHQALCEAAGFEGALHRCSIYGSREAGERLLAMMEMGRSRPWQDAMAALTGQRQLDASALLDYYAPLLAWLETENADRACGW